jgi:hypothetical protein
MGIKDIGSTDIGYKTSTDGLLLYLDAGNPNSYPEYGTIWYDLSPKVNNSNIPPATVYTPASSSFYTNGNNGSFVRFDIPQINSSTNVITVELVFKWEQNNPGPYEIIFGFNFYTLMIMPFFAYNTGNGLFQTAAGFNPQVGNWFHLVCEMYQTPTPKDGNNKLWINGVNQTLTNGGGDTVNQDFNNGIGRIADAIGWLQNYNTIGYYSIFKIYDRILSQQEITDNYKHYKTRYPLL